MINVGEDELICDLAETYHILNYRELSPVLVATLSVGLREDSRIKKKITGVSISAEQMLMAIMADNLQFLAWTKTKEAEKGKGRPDSILQKLLGNDKKSDDLLTFKTPDEYEEYMKKKREELQWQQQ